MCVLAKCSELGTLLHPPNAPASLTGTSACVQKGTECHHIVVEDWSKMEQDRGCLFVSIPSLLDSSLAPEGFHTFHAFAPEYIDDYKGLTGKEYTTLKEKRADEIIDRLAAAVFPGLRDAIVFREVRCWPSNNSNYHRNDHITCASLLPVRAELWLGWHVRGVCKCGVIGLCVQPRARFTSAP
jgi:phytoene dehydrogenase-like protein